ncbi:MAG: PQQ-dependent dehydrogenase, methanol/ethanol family [Candidatus Andeanibacterium colombiense]|uniref:PQQ-dependent dehydrogenase, methanol/ethanol family n=1 Tax=Candidatus Andeanibacterium colombiense TaxID=3121345 RepID=A0AAJ5X4Z9_9SPHN|nr:MAG: PQQ-dependent dehydrogenase, methanol/ethanol family [Sphingomonadaceae bacterium]
MFRKLVAALMVLSVSLAGAAWAAGKVDPLASPLASAWPSDGRDYTAQRYSPLTQIDAANVNKLGLAWYDDLGTMRGIEATPIYADGVLYNTLAWNITSAYDAKTGKKLWTYDPQVPREYGRYACCEPVARGLAMSGNKVIIGTLDGRLIALDRKTGKPLWTTQTFPEGTSYAYSITGAPRVFGDMVVVGQSGGDLGVRGFVAAWDVNTGKKRWKFFLTPNPEDKLDGEASDPVIAMMRKTWSDEGMWKTLGGGANPWDSIAYDPVNKLVFVGTGNSSPHTQFYRSPGGGDNLFTCSIVALNAKDGSYAWHYQMLPGEEWDWTCTSSMIQADLTIDGKPRQVLMQAPKDGFFYVLDRKTGKLISAKPFVKTNWNLGFDENGRPNINPAVRYTTDPALVYPGPGGGHNWFPMAYSPRTKLAYFPSYQSGFVYARQDGWTPQPFRSNSGWGGYSGDALKKRMELQKLADADEKAFLTAWDPVKQQVAWQVPLPRHGNGGVMVTASDLVFEGTTKQTFAAFDARSGKVLWEFPTQSAPVAGGITYMLDGVQYIAVNAGWGGGAGQVERGAGTELPRANARLLVFKLGGTAQLPALAKADPIPQPPPLRGTEAQIQKGAQLFADTCAQCHGRLAVGGVKDLRHLTPETHAKFNDIVLGGIYKDKGMVSFADILKPEDAEAIHQYLIARANEDWGGK